MEQNIRWKINTKGHPNLGTLLHRMLIEKDYFTSLLTLLAVPLPGK